MNLALQAAQCRRSNGVAPITASRKARLNRALTSAIETLEARQLLSSTYSGNNDYNLNGSTLTVTPVGTSTSTQYTVDNNLTLVGTGAAQHFIVTNYSGQLNIDGQGGADTYLINTGAGGTVTIDDTSNSTAQSHLTVIAPTLVAANVTLTAGQVLVGSDTVDFTNSVSQLTLNGQLFGNADALTVNGSNNDVFTVQGSQLGFDGLPVFYSTFTNLTVNAGTGTSSFTVSGDSIPTNLYAGAGNAIFNVISNFVPLSLNGGATGNDQFNIQGNSSTLTANGGAAGSNTFTVISNSATLTLNGGTSSPLNTVNVDGNAGNLTVNDQGTTSNVHVLSTNGQVTVNGSGSGADTLTVDAANAPINFFGGGGTSAVTATAPLFATLTVAGGTGTSRTLTVDATLAADTIGISNAAVSVAGYAPVDYSQLTGLIVNGENGNDVFVVSSDAAATTVNGGTGNDEFDVNADSALITINTGTGSSVINVGSKAPGTGGTLAPIAGGVSVVGDNGDTLNLDDSGDAVSGSGILSAAGLSGFGLASAGPITYSGLLSLNLSLGKGGNTLQVSGTSATTTTVNLGAGNDTANIQATGSGTTTNINGNGGTNTFNIGSTEPTAGGVVDHIAGVLNVNGNGSDSLSIDDTGSTGTKTGTLTSLAVSGLSPVAINYTGINLLNISLGSGGNTFTIQSTITGTTDLNSGSGNDTVALLENEGPTNINSGSGTNAVNIKAIGAATVITGGVSGSTTTTVGSKAPASGGVLTGILAALTVNGGVTDTLIADDTGATSAANGAISPTVITGLGLLFTGIAYSGVGTVDVNLGNAGSTFTVTNTAAASAVNVTSGSGVDTITIDADASATTVNTGAGATDAVNVISTGGTTGITTAGAVTIGSLSPALGGNLDGISEAVTVTGAPSAKLILDDSGSTSGKTGLLTATALTGLGNAAINYSNISTLSLKLGSGGDALNIQGTGATTTNVTAAGGVNTFTVGSIAPSIGGVTANIGGSLSITGSGNDGLIVDDSGDLNTTTSALTPTQLSGLTTNPLAYSGIKSLTVDLGTAGNMLSVTNTITGTTTINGGVTADTINVKATAGATVINTGAGADTVNVGSNAPSTGGTINGILNNSLTVNGSSNNATLNIDDTGTTAARSATIHASNVVIGPVGINYSSLANLNVKLGNGIDTVTVAGTAGITNTAITTGSSADLLYVQTTTGPLVVNGGTGKNSFILGSLAPTLGGNLDGLLGAVTLNGSSADSLVLDDTGSKLSKTGSLSGTALTGLGTAGVNYNGMATLTLSFGSGGDTLNITSTSAATTTNVNDGAGVDTINVLNDNGLTNISTQGASADAVNIQAIHGVTVVHTGSEADVVTVGSLAPALGGSLAGIDASLSIIGGGNSTLIMDDSSDAASKTLTITASNIAGLTPSSLPYSGISNLKVYTGTGGSAVTVTGTSAKTGTTITSNGGVNAVMLSTTSTSGLGAVLAGPVAIIGLNGGTNTLTVDDSTDGTARVVAVTASTVSGIGPIETYTGQTTLNLKLGTGSDSLTATDPAVATASYNGGGGTNTANLIFAKDLNNTVSLINFATTTANVAGNLTGSIATTGKLDATVAGNAPGVITAASVGTIGVAAATTGVGNAVLSVTQAGTYRRVFANPVSGSNVGSLTFKLLYDGTASNPQLAARVTNTQSARFDLMLQAPVGSNFDLSRFDTAANAVADVRNIIVEGSLLNALTGGENAYFAYASGTTGGVYLPADNLASVATWNSIHVNSIRVLGIEGLAFANLVDSSNTSHAATSLTSESSEALLLTPLAYNSTSKTYYEAVNLPTDTLVVPFSKLATVGLFTDGSEGKDDSTVKVGTTNNGDFEEHGLLFSDQAANSPVVSAYSGNAIVAAATFADNATLGTSWVTNLGFTGDGGSVDSSTNIQNITSSGALGDLLLRGNSTSSTVKTTLNSVTAPAIFGNVDLFGGAVSGTIQTTGLRIDPASGATTVIPADLGRLISSGSSITGATYLHANLLIGSKVVSRGNLFSTVEVDNALLGIVAAAGNIGGIATTGTGAAVLSKSGSLSRYGGVQVKGTGTANTSTGQIIALGNIYGDISFSGIFAGRIAATGTAVSGLAANRVGILGNVTIGAGMPVSGAIVSAGEIGDTSNGTKLKISGTDTGFVAAKGAVSLSNTLPAGRVIQNQVNAGATAANANQIDAIFTNNGALLGLDISGQNLAGLQFITTDLLNLALSGSVLSGAKA